MKNTTIYFVMLLFILPSVMPAETTVSSVEKNLMCTCSCTMALYTCECGTSEEMRSDVQEMIDKGMDKDQILASYVGQYGEKILSAPTKEGFNLAAWITPFLAIVVFGGVLYKVLHRWSKKQNQTLPTEDINPEYDRRLKQELEQFEEGEVS